MHPLLPDIDSLTLAQQVAQMVVVRASGFLFDHQIQYPDWEPPAATLHHWLKDLGVGGVILLGGSAGEVALRSRQLQEWASIPLLLTADVEEGVGQRFSGATWFPPPLALNAIAQRDRALAETYAEQMGSAIAQEARAIGLNWVLAPVVDVNNNPDNPVINVRAFGETTEVVTRLTTAFIRGVQQHPVLSVAKHFPGHGDTAVDSHLELPVLPHAIDRLQQVELPPFEAAISAGVDTVMSAHLQIPALDADNPATLSRTILTGRLRQGMGFEGLIVTDALVMGAIARRYGANDAPVRAVEAGADIVLMPIDPAGAIQAICEAVAAGRISPERIRASVERIWQAKQKVCGLSSGGTCHTWETANGEEASSIVTQLAQPATRNLSAAILRDSMQVYSPVLSRLNNGVETGDRRNLILVDDGLGCDFLGRHTPAIAIPAARGYHTQILDATSPFIPDQATFPWQPTLLQLFIRGNPFRGSAGLTQSAHQWLNWLVQSEQLQALVIYGSPYILEKFLPELPPEVSYIFSYGQMPEAQAIALQTLLQ